MTFAVRAPLGPWAVWVRQQRLARQWSETDLVEALRTFPPSAAPLVGDTSPEGLVREVRRWEAGHWAPGDAAQARLVETFGTTPDDLTPDTAPAPAPGPVPPGAARWGLPSVERSVLASELQVVRALLINDMGEQACERLDRLAESVTAGADLHDHVDRIVDEDGWDL